MAGWYVRRGENVIGPIDGTKLKELAATGKLQPTDQIAKDAGGPWTEARRSSLFPKEPSKADGTQPPAIIPTAKQLPAVPQPQSTELTPQKSKVAVVVTTTKVVVGTVGRGLQSVGGAIGRSLAERSRRKHELKLAEIQAKAMADANRPPAIPQQSPAPAPVQTPASSQPIVFAPQMTTVVNVVNKNNADGCGCSGCASLIVLAFLGLVLWAIIANNNSSQPSRPPPSSSSR